MRLTYFGILYSLATILPSFTVCCDQDDPDDTTVSFIDQVRHQWTPMAPVHALNLVHAMQDILQRNTSMGLYWHADGSAPALVMQHFFKTRSVGELFRQIEGVRDPAKLCPLVAFVHALLRRLRLEFLLFPDMREWRAEVQASLQHVQDKFGKIALSQRGIDEDWDNTQCTEWQNSPDSSALAQALQIDWHWNDEAVPDFVLRTISINFAEFLHNNGPHSIADRVALMQHISRETARAVLGRVPAKFATEFPYGDFVDGLKVKSVGELMAELSNKMVKQMGSLVEELANKADVHLLKKGFSVNNPNFFGNLIEFLAKIAKLKVRIGALNLYVEKSNKNFENGKEFDKFGESAESSNNNLDKNEKTLQEKSDRDEMPEIVQKLKKNNEIIDESIKTLIDNRNHINLDKNEKSWHDKVDKESPGIIQKLMEHNAIIDESIKEWQEYFHKKKVQKLNHNRDKSEKSWQENDKKEKSWQENFNKNEVPESVQLLVELYAFGREMGKQLLENQPPNDQLQLLALKHWPMNAIVEHFSNFVEGFETYLQSAHLYIAPERMNAVINQKDTCMAWLDGLKNDEKEIANLC